MARLLAFSGRVESIISVLSNVLVTGFKHLSFLSLFAGIGEGVS